MGAEYVARAEPDGYTVLVGSNGPLTINPIINPNVSYGCQGLRRGGAGQLRAARVLIVSDELGVKSISDLVALSKTRPINLATSGVGSASRMTLERVQAGDRRPDPHTCPTRAAARCCRT